MSDITLYRKYRPRTFDDVVGQDNVVAALKGAVENNTFSHAYLFSGSRGLGKTSIARILAHAIGTTDRDIHEMDAASNRRIDDVRELRDAVNTRPFESPYKVYIIDEVHMLTTEAFNALLKTLEEPPSHAVFMLATTEIDKLPDTVISRCQTFSFKRPNHETLRRMLTDIAGQEGYNLDDGAASLLALLGEGSFRDAQGMLQKVMSALPNKKGKDAKSITAEDVERVTEVPRGELVNTFIASLAHGDTETGLGAIEELVAANGNIRTFAYIVLERLRSVLLLRFAPKEKERIAETLSDDDFSFLAEIAADKTAEINSRTLDVMLEATENMKFAYLPQLPLELALTKIAERKQFDIKE